MASFDFQRRDGSWTRESREAYDDGRIADGKTIMLLQWAADRLSQA